MAGLRTGAPIVQVYHEKSRILPDVSRVLSCLYEKDIKFETHTASYKSLLKLQASTRAPVPFSDGPIFLEDSREICHHIAEKYERAGYPSLLGKDALERASVEQWLHNEEHAFNPPSRALFCHLAFPPNKDENDNDIDMHTRKLEEVLEVYEQRLRDSEFLAGNMFTLADLVHLPNSHYITSSDKFVYLYDSRKNVRRWWDTISTRHSWQQVLMYMERVEEQNKQEELKEKQQKSRPKTPSYPLRIYSRKQTITKPRTVLMHPAGSVPSSAMTQTEKPLPIDISDEPLVSSSQSTPTDPKTSVAKSEKTPFHEKPPHKSPTPVQSTIAPVTSPITPEKPQTVDADSLSSKAGSTPEPTKTDLPTRHKPSSSKVVSNNLHVFDYYKVSIHSEEAKPYIEPTRQKGSETLDQFSESSIAAGHTKTSSIPAEEEPDQRSKSDFYKSEITSTGVDSQDKDSIPYNEHTPQSARPTDSTASKHRRTDVYHKRQVEQLHAATTVPSDLKEDVDHLRPIQQVKSSKVVHQHSSQDSEQATSRPVPQESMSMKLVEGQAKIIQRPYTYQGRDVSSPLSQQNGGAQEIAVDNKASFDQSSALLPTTQKNIATPPSRKARDKETRSTSPPQAGYGDGQDTNKQLRDPGSIARQPAARATFGESKAAGSMISSGGSSDAFRSPLPRQDLNAARNTTAPFEKKDPLTQYATEQTKDIISTPWQMVTQDIEDTENTTEETNTRDSSSSLVQPSYSQRARAPSEKQGTSEGLVREKEATEDHHGVTSPIHKRHANIEDTTGQYRSTAFKPKQMISQDDQETFKGATFGDPSLLREQPPGTQQAATATDKETNQDDLSVAPPSQRTQTIYPSVAASRMRYPFTKDASEQPRGALSTPRPEITQDDNDTSEESMIADEVASTQQHFNARRALISPHRQEVEDSPREMTSFQKRPYVEDKQVGDTTSQRIAPTGVKDTFEETKNADSSLASKKPMYTQQSALPPRRQAEFQHAQEIGRQSEARSPEPKKMVSRDARDTHGERKTGTPGELSSGRLQSISQPRQGAAEDARGATGESVQFPDIFDTTKKSRDTFEKTQDGSPTLPRARPFGAQDAPESKTPTADHQRMDVSTQLQSDAHDWFLQSKLPAAVQKGLGSLPSQERDTKDLHATLSEEKPVSSERPREVIKKTQPTTPKEHPIDTQGSIKVEKTPFVYHKKPLFAQDSQDQPKIIPHGGKGDDSTWEHKEASDDPYNEEQLSAPVQARAKFRNDFDAEQSHKKYTTSQVQPPGTSQDSASHGHLSSELSAIEKWRHTSTPLKDTTSRSGEQRVETPILPTERERTGFQSASPSLLEATTTDHAVIDDKFAKQSIIDESLGEPKQMQPPVTGVRSASPTKRKTPDGPETGGLELIRSFGGQILDAAKVIPSGPAIIHEDSHDAVVDKKTTYDANSDQLVTGPLHEPTWPPAPTHEETEPMDGLQTSKEPQFRGSSQAELAHAERKSTLSDQRPARAAPLSPVEPVNIDSNDHAADGTIAPQMIFRQETRPSTPIIRRVPALDSQSVTRKVQEVTPDYHRTEDSGKPLIPSQDDQISHTSQAISHQEDMKYLPSTRDSQKSDVQPPSAQIHDPPIVHKDVDDVAKDTFKGMKYADSTPSSAKTIYTALTPSMQGEVQDARDEGRQTSKAIPEEQKKVEQERGISERQLSDHRPSGQEAVEDVRGVTGDTIQSPHILDEKFSASAPAGADIHDDPRAEVSYRKDTTANQKVEPPLLSQKPTSQVHRASEPYQVAAPHGYLSSKLSKNDQWQHASGLLKGANTDSNDNDINMSSNIEQKPMPVSQEEHLSSQHANHMAQQSGEQTVEPPEYAAPSPPEAATADHSVIDDKFVKQSIIDERGGEPKQIQAPITDVHPASSSAKRKILDGRETADLEFGGSSQDKILYAGKDISLDPATICEDSNDVAIDDKTTTYDASGDHLVTRSLHEQERPPAPTHEVTEAIGGRTSNEPQLGGSSQTEVASTEHKSTPSGSDQKTSRASQPLSPVEPVNIDSNDSIASQMIFWQQTISSAPVTRGEPALDSESVTRKIQEVSPDNRHTGDSGKPLVPSQEDQNLHASQAIPRQEDITYSPSVRDSPKSDTQLSSAQVREVTPDESSEKQGSHVGSTFGSYESGPAEKKFAPSGLGHSTEEPSSAEPMKSTAEHIKAQPTVIGQQGTQETRKVPTSEYALDTIPTHGDVHSTTSTKPPRISLSVQGAEPTSSAQAPAFHVAHDTLHTGTTPDDALGNAQSMKPLASPDAQHGITPENNAGEVTPAEHNFVPSGQEFVHSTQSPTSTVQRNEVIGDSTPETQQISSTDQAKSIATKLGQQEIISTPLRLVSPTSYAHIPSEKAREDAPQDVREAASKQASQIREIRPPRVVPASAPATHGAATYEEALDIQKFVPSGQDSVRSTKPPSYPEQRNGGIGDSAPSTQWNSSTKQRKGDALTSAPDQENDSQITPRQQDMLPPVRSVSPSSDLQRRSGKVHEDVPPDALGEARPIVQASAQDLHNETAADETVPNEKKFILPESTSSTEPRNEEIRNSVPSEQLISSTETRKENATIMAPGQDKDSETALDQQGIFSAPVKLASPSSYTHRPSKKIQDDASAGMGEAASEPSATVPEVRASTVVPESAPVTQRGATSDEAGKNYVHSRPLKNEEIGDSAPSTQQISSINPRKGDVAASAPDQAKDTQMTLGRQPVRLVSPSSDTQLPADDLREAKNFVQASAPDTQDEKKFTPSEPSSSTEPRNKEIRDPSTDPRKEDIVAAPKRDKNLETTPNQQDIQSVQVRAASPPSDAQHPSEKAREDAPADDLGEAASKSVQEVRPPTVVPASAPVRLHGAAPNESEATRDEQRILPSGQDSTQSVQPSFSSEQTKEDIVVSTVDQTGELQTTFHQLSITPTDTEKTPLPGTKDVSRNSQENISDDIDTDESIPGEERVSIGQREGHATEPYITTVDEKTTTSPSSKAYSSESGSGLTHARTDVHPPTDDESSGESEHKEQADQAIVQSPDGNVKQIEQAKTHNTEAGEPEERDPQENTNRTNNEVPRVEALDTSETETSGVQPRGANMKNASDSTEDAPHDIQTRSNSNDSLRSSEESKVLQQPEGKTQGGETEAPDSDIVEQNGRGLPENSYQNNSNRQPRAETSDRSAENSFPGQNYVHSRPLKNEDIGDSAPSTQQISSIRPRKGDVAASAPDQAKDTQMTLGRQDLFPPGRLVSPSSDTQLPADDLREAKNFVQASAPDTRDEKKFTPSEPFSSTEPRNKEIRDPSTDPRREYIVAAPKRDKNLETTPNQQDIQSLQVRVASPSSDTQHPSEKAQEDAPAHDLGEAASKSLQVRPPTVVPASAPVRLHGAAPRESEASRDEQRILSSGQDSTQSVQPSFSSEQTKEDTVVTTIDQTEELQTTFHQQSITPTDTAKTPRPGTKDVSRNSQENISDDIDTDESIPEEERVSIGQREGHATEPYITTVDEKTTTSPSNKAYSSESGSGSTQARTDVHPPTGEESSGESEHKEQADQAIIQSPDGNVKQIEQTKTHETEVGEPEERDPQENTNRTNNEVPRMEALDTSETETSGVQPRGANTKNASDSTEDAPHDIQTRSNSSDSLRSSKESKVLQQPEGKTQGGETEDSDTVEQNGRGLPENSYQNNSSRQPRAETSDRSAENFLPGIKNENKSSSDLDGPTDDGTKSDDAEDKSG